MTPELLQAVVDGRLEVCLFDVKSLVSSVTVGLHMIADEIGSGDESIIRQAPEEIRALIDKLQEGIKECAKKHCAEDEPEVEVEFRDLIKEVLSLPFAGTPEVRTIGAGGKITIYRKLVLATLYEVMATICKSNATKIVLELLPREREMLVLATFNGPGVRSTNLALARRLIQNVEGDITASNTGMELMIIVPNLGARTDIPSI